MDLSYNISVNLSSNLSKIERLKIEILTYPISPKNELRFRWNVNLDRIFSELSIGNDTVSRDSITKVLSSPPATRKQMDNNETEAIAFRNALEYIKENWMVSPTPVTMNTIKKLYDIACRPSMGKASGLTEYSERRMGALLAYLQKGQDIPLFQAGIAQSELIHITPFDNGNGRVARLLSYLYLYKGGWDFRQMLNLEEYYKRDIGSYKNMLNLAKVQGNMTVWLEYFIFGIVSSLEKTLEGVREMKFQDNLRASYWKLNERQKSILEKLDNPEETITNKEVQNLFGVSQITASRDLSHMVSLGFLFTHGKGRSVFYTKV